MSFKPPLKILRASAGSGKTFSLTVHFLVFLFSGTKKYREILAVTFTNKATAEMKERVLSVLEGLATGSSDADIYREYIKEAFPTFSDLAIQTNATIIYKDILHDYGRFSINTIDKFVQQVVRSFNFELGIEAGYRIEMNMAKVASDLSGKLHDTLSEKPELLKWVIDFAKEKIANNERWEYQETLKKIAYQIFTENFQRFEQVIQKDSSDTLFSETSKKVEETIEGYEKQLITRFLIIQELARSVHLSADDFKAKSRNPLSQLAEGKEAEISEIVLFFSKVSKYVDDFDEWVHPKSKNPEGIKTLYAVLNGPLSESYLFYVENNPDYLLAKLIDQNLYYLRLIREMSTLLGAYRKENSLLLISDANALLSKINEGQEDNPSFIWEKVGNRYKNFLFDEFQDTSKGQWQNFLPILKNVLSESPGKETEHLIVGDVKQSIYRWRSGDSRLLLSQVEEDLGAAFVENDSLLENYRSSENIINFNNYIFDHAPAWVQNRVNNLVTNDSDAQAYWENMNYDSIIVRSYADSHQRSPSSVKAGGIIKINEIEVASNAHRASQTKPEALQITADALYEWIETEKRYRPSQIGILVRNGKDAVALIDFLYKDLKKRENQHAYQVVSGSALLIANNDAINLLINLFELLRSTEDEARIFKANSIQLYAQLKNQKLTHEVSITGDDWIKIKNVPLSDLTEFLPESFCRKGHDLLQLPFSELFEQLIHDFSLNDSKSDIPYLFSLRDKVASFTSQGDKGIDAFLKWWYEEKNNFFLPADESGEVIHVVTIHKSKGLAYDVVMLPLLGWEIGKAFPKENLWVDLKDTSFQELDYVPLGFNPTMKDSSLNMAFYEESMLRYLDALNEIYVALTRAKECLFINLIGESGKRPLDKIFIASDIIRFALEGIKSEQLPGLVEIELPSFTSNQAEKTESNNSWSFSDYPLSQQLKVELNKETKRQLQSISASKKQRMGILAHDLLARTNRHRIDKDLLEMQYEGLFKEGEMEDVRDMVLKVLQNKRLLEILSDSYEELNEQEIISSGGMSYRPDKILLKPEEAVIIDFKFTEKKESVHRDQIENYKYLLSEMKIPMVKGYLFYGLLDELVSV